MTYYKLKTKHPVITLKTVHTEDDNYTFEVHATSTQKKVVESNFH